MDFALLSQIAFKSLWCNPNSNAISVRFLEYFSENITLWERKRERERDFSSTRSYLLFVGCWEGLDEMEVGFTTFFFFVLACRCITFHGHLSQVRTWQKTSLIKDPWGVSFYFNFLCIHHGGIICIYFYTTYTNTSQPAGYHNE